MRRRIVLDVDFTADHDGKASTDQRIAQVVERLVEYHWDVASDGLDVPNVLSAVVADVTDVK